MIMGFGFGRFTATVLAVLTLVLMSVSSIFYVSGVPVLMELGAEGLFTFLLFATYFAHLKPYLQSGHGIPGNAREGLAVSPPPEFHHGTLKHLEHP